MDRACSMANNVLHRHIRADSSARPRTKHNTSEEEAGPTQLLAHVLVPFFLEGTCYSVCHVRYCHHVSSRVRVSALTLY